MNRRDTVGALLALGAVPLTSFAQPQGKVWRIGFLSSESAARFGNGSRVEAFRAGLRDLGYEEGKNLVIEFRWAEGKNDRLPELAAELVRLKVDVIVTHAIFPVRAAKNATATIPIVFASSGDVVDLGFVPNLARPGGNMTGGIFFVVELAAKRIELIKEVLPRLTTVAWLVNPDSPAIQSYSQKMEATARSSKVTLHKFPVRGPHEFETALAAMVKQRVGAVVLIDDPSYIANSTTLAQLAAKHMLPSIGFNEIAVAGGLMGYGVNFDGMFRRAAYFVDKILKGAKPGDIPIEQATKFDLVINLKTAKALGITIPKTVLFRADRVIE